jgi:MFS family permease
MGILILSRVLQGLGGGGLDVLGEIILADITSLKERPLYLGLFSIPMAGGAICGPIVGAALAENASWRWIGWVNLPLGVTGLLLFFFSLRLKPIETTLAFKLARLDWTGMVLFLVGSTLFSLPLSWAGALYPWASYKTLVPFILGFLVLISFGFYEARPVQPLFPYRIFKSRTATFTLIGSFMHGAVLNGGLLYLLLSFQATFRHALQIRHRGTADLRFHCRIQHRRSCQCRSPSEIQTTNRCRMAVSGSRCWPLCAMETRRL